MDSVLQHLLTKKQFKNWLIATDSVLSVAET